MTFEDYRALAAVNISSLLHMLVSPKHYLHHMHNPSEDTDALRLGRAFHCATLEPDDFDARHIVWTGDRRYGKAWDEFVAEAGSRAILTRDQHKQVFAMSTAIWGHPLAGQLLSMLGVAEHTLQWVDPRTEIGCKARLDWMTTEIIVDLKTTRAIDPNGFGRQCASLNYHLRCAFYQDAAAAQDGVVRPVYLVAVEKEPPHDVVCYRMPDDALDSGRRQYRGLLERLAECRASDKWPGIGDGEVTLELPPWAFEPEEPFTIRVGGEEHAV